MIEIIKFLKSGHTVGQTVNLLKYIYGGKKNIVNWDPLSISLFLTYKCNLNCDMCLTHSSKFRNVFGQKPANDIDFNFFKQIVHRYKNALSINLIGNGDPLLNKDLFRMIDYASSVMKMEVNSGSNGILVGNYIEEILESRLNQFDISLNGHNSSEFNRMTGMDQKKFDLICDNIAELTKQKKAKNSKVKIVASIILDQMNYAHIKDMVYFANDLNVDEIIFFQFLPVNESGFKAEDRCLFNDTSDILKVFSEINSLPEQILKKIRLPRLLDRVMNNNKYCPVWFYNLSIDGDGNAGGCCCQILDLSPSGKFSDIYVWNNPYFQSMRNRFIDPKASLLQPCTWCYNNSSQKQGILGTINLPLRSRIIDFALSRSKR